MQLGNRTTITSIPRKTIDVEFPEYGNSYRLRAMSGTDKDKWDFAQFKSFKKNDDGSDSVNPLYLRATLVSLCLVEENGARLFADDEVSQLSDQLPADVVERLYSAARTLNGLDPDAVEAAVKNSASVPSDSSTSA